VAAVVPQLASGTATATDTVNFKQLINFLITCNLIYYLF